MNNFEKLYPQNRPSDVAPEHCFDLNLADFEWVINNNFIQLEAERLNDINYFSRESSN